MGSLSSRPNVPTIPTSPPPVTAPITPITTQTPVIDSAAQQSAQRTQSLLRRNRGVTGTIQTGFRGLLAQSDNAAPRKTLLGE